MNHDVEKAIEETRKPDSKWTVADSGRDAETIHDLKRKLSDSIAREQEIERELEETRAHADALAGALEEIMQARKQWEVRRDEAWASQDWPDEIRDEIGGPYQRCMDDVLRAVAINHPEAESALTAYRNRERGNESHGGEEW